MPLNALALEYQRYYGMAGRHLKLTDLVNDPTGQSPIRVLGLSLQEQSFNSRFVELCTVFDNRSNPLLVGLDSAGSGGPCLLERFGMIQG